MRGRGLKPEPQRHKNNQEPSPPMRGRGLKQLLPNLQHGSHNVAPHAGAWIETTDIGITAAMSSSRPPCGGVD